MFFPGIDETKLFPQEAMHLEGDGLLAGEAYALLYIVIQRQKCITLEAVNSKIAHAPKGVWSGDGVPIRPIHPNVLIGARGQLPRPDGRIRFTASEMHKFALASNYLLGDLIPEDNIFFICWKLHVQYLKIMLQHVFNGKDIMLMDMLIYKHQELFSKV